jgi:hypothetical protein
MAEYIERSNIEFPYMTMSMWGINSATCKAYNEGVKAVEDAIIAIPSADVEPIKHAEWRICCDGWYPYCSNCGYEPPWVAHIDMRTPRCPYCGAKMRKEGED